MIFSHVPSTTIDHASSPCLLPTESHHRVVERRGRLFEGYASCKSSTIIVIMIVSFSSVPSIIEGIAPTSSSDDESNSYIVPTAKYGEWSICYLRVNIVTILLSHSFIVPTTTLSKLLSQSKVGLAWWRENLRRFVAWNDYIDVVCWWLISGRLLLKRCSVDVS